MLVQLMPSPDVSHGSIGLWCRRRRHRTLWARFDFGDPGIEVKSSAQCWWCWPSPWRVGWNERCVGLSWLRCIEVYGVSSNEHCQGLLHLSNRLLWSLGQQSPPSWPWRMGEISNLHVRLRLAPRPRTRDWCSIAARIKNSAFATAEKLRKPCEFMLRSQHHQFIISAWIHHT